MPRTEHQTAVACLEEVCPRGLNPSGAQSCLSVVEFRKALEHLQARHLIATLPPPEHAPGERPRLVLAFVGGWAGQARWAAPLLEALEIPAYFFLPLQSLGARERLSLTDLRALGQIPQAHLALDLSAEDLMPSRDLVVHLRQAIALLTHWAGSQAPYVWMGDCRWDRRLPLLLRQTGFAGMITTRTRGWGPGGGLTLFQAHRLTARRSP